jgi:hypothetical protein
MPDHDVQETVSCPNCQQSMQTQDFERHDHGTVRVFLCFPCAGIWFDHLGSVQLAPAAVIELFKEIYAHRDASRQPVAGRLGCPRCPEALALSFDVCKTGRFSYFLCHNGDGRYTPFFQFLREKQFVRSLTSVELQRVRAEVRQITCSQCGASIDLEHDTQCKYCHSPVSFLDPDAVEKAVRVWSDADHRSHLRPSPDALGSVLLSTQPRSTIGAAPQASGLSDRLLLALRDAEPGAPLGPDLVSWGIHAIGRLFAGN